MYSLVNYGIRLEINTNPKGAEPVWAEIGEGVNNAQETLNENKEQGYYLADNGYGHSDITAMSPSWTITGNRKYGDPAQDFIFSKMKYELGCNRKTQIKVTVKNTCDGTTILARYYANVTVSDIQEWGGAAESLSEMSFTLDFNGKPEPIPQDPTITNAGAVVTLTSDEDATIYYTIDGADPDESSTLYAEPFTLAASATVKAIAMLGNQKSGISSKSIVVS